MTANVAYEKIIEIENNPQRKQQLIDATFDLYKRKFNPEVVKKLWE